MSNTIIFLSLLATAGILIGWQFWGDVRSTRNWLGISALFLELLAAGMAIAWAGRQGAGILMIFFIFGFIGLSLAKATAAATLVNVYYRRNNPALIVGIVTLAGVYLAVYFAGSFEGTISTAQESAAAAMRSAPIAAVDAQLAAAKTRLESLAGFADAGRANQEESARAAHETQLAAARAELANCPRDYITKCIKPAQQRIALLQNQNVGNYAARHSEYLSLMQRIADLETKRAELLSGGGLAQASAGSADDRLIAWATGLDMERAAGIKWLLFVLAFDVLSLGLRLFGELSNVSFNTSKPLHERTLHETHRKPSHEPLHEPPPRVGFLASLDVNTSNMRSSDVGTSDNGFTNTLSDVNTNRKKGDRANCVGCGAIIILKHRNHIRCHECKKKHESAFRMQHLKRLTDSTR